MKTFDNDCLSEVDVASKKYHREYNKKYREEHKQDYTKHNKQYYAEHKNYFHDYNKKYREKYKKEFKEYYNLPYVKMVGKVRGWKLRHNYPSPELAVFPESWGEAEITEYKRQWENRK